MLIKTLSKPLSKRIKHEFSRTEVTQKLLIFIGQTSHQVTSRMTIWSAGYKVRKISPLEEEKALKQGAEFVGESVVFLVSGGWILYEYNQSVMKNNAKDEIRRKQAKSERQALQAQLTQLEERIIYLEAAVKAANGESNTNEDDPNSTKNIQARGNLPRPPSWYSRLFGIYTTNSSS